MSCLLKDGKTVLLAPAESTLCALCGRKVHVLRMVPGWLKGPRDGMYSYSMSMSSMYLNRQPFVVFVVPKHPIPDLTESKFCFEGSLTSQSGRPSSSPRYMLIL